MITERFSYDSNPNILSPQQATESLIVSRNVTDRTAAYMAMRQEAEAYENWLRYQAQSLLTVTFIQPQLPTTEQARDILAKAGARADFQYPNDSRHRSWIARIREYLTGNKEDGAVYPN